jgi:hypothetical protein
MRLTREAAAAIDAARLEGRITEGSRVRLLDAPPMLEEELLQRVLLLAKAYGWRSFHARPGRTKGGWATPVQGDGKGFVDVVLVRERVVWTELKSQAGVQSPEQKEWAAALLAAGEEYYLWRPSDLGTIIQQALEKP